MSVDALTSERAASLRPLVQAGAPRLLADLANLIRIPSVSWSGFDPAHLEQSAHAVARLFEDTGLFPSVRVVPTSGAPAVVARREPRKGAPTVVLYAHHDVQPPGPEDLWQSPAYQPTVREGRLYGRGSADDKAGIAVHLAALRAIAQAEQETLDLGIVVFIEGEEENGSPSFSSFLDSHADVLAGDIIIVPDSDNPATTEPALTVSLRGNVTAVLTIETLDHALHSGMFGGAVPDALTVFSLVAGSFYRPDGSLAIAGLEPSVGTNEAEEQRVGAEAGLLEGVLEVGSGSVADRVWRSPALTITGLDVPSVQNASNTLLPSVRAKLSLRVAPGSSAAESRKALEDHIAAVMPLGATWSLSDVSLGEPFSVDPHRDAMEVAAHALHAAFGNPPRYQGVGGSIPFISDLVRRFPEADILITGVEDPDTRAHSPNESLDLGVLWRAALAETTLLSLLNRR